MAASAIDTLEHPDLIVRAKEEFDRRTGGQAYVSPIPPDVTPRIQ